MGSAQSRWVLKFGPIVPRKLGANGSLLTRRWRGESRANPSLETPRNSARIRRKRDRLSGGGRPPLWHFIPVHNARAHALEATGHRCKPH